MHRTVAAALAAALALGLAGCGGGERTQTTGRAPLVRRLADACKAGERAGRRELGERAGQVAFVLAQRKSLQTIGDQIDGLETTGRAKADLAAYKRTIRTRLDLLASVAAADAADRRRVLTAELPAINAAGTRAHTLVLALSEQLRLVCF